MLRGVTFAVAGVVLQMLRNVDTINNLHLCEIYGILYSRG
jgi:hypothetical protein